MSAARDPEEPERARQPERRAGWCPFDFVAGTAPGVFAALTNAEGRVVLLSEWPTSLLDMRRAGVLVGRARRLAAELEELQAGAVTVSPRRASPWAI